MSLSQHRQASHSSPLSDLESLIYTILFLAMGGRLPWYPLQSTTYSTPMDGEGS